MGLSRVYKALLRLYPPDHRAAFADEMLAVFEESAEERRQAGLTAFIRFAIEELIGVVKEAGAERAEMFACFFDGSRRSSSTVAAYRMLQKMRPSWVTQEVFFKGIDLLDGSGACASRRQRSLPDEVVEAEARIGFLLGRMVDAISDQEFEKARFYSDEEGKERERLRLLRARYNIGHKD
jgi:hypothetical protein